MIETFVGVLLALIAYRALLIVGASLLRILLRAWIKRDRDRAMASGGVFSGSWSRPWRLANRMGIRLGGF